ncbi:hypothetical protein L596_022628 [Steinernema carpocapsae]|uniref:ShKT domain-containing protein n=1 Tax=Steinernema carpocapsae TaxID=34508 RepID=A0A4U5MM90_STECR|nr:hypothetical protein L596_022628 [Steinernema carpocapsae]
MLAPVLVLSFLCAHIYAQDLGIGIGDLCDPAGGMGCDVGVCDEATQTCVEAPTDPPTLPPVVVPNPDPFTNPPTDTGNGNGPDTNPVGVPDPGNRFPSDGRRGSNRGNSNCVDRIFDCRQKRYLCSNSVYYDFMTTQCPATCGRCSGTRGETGRRNNGNRGNGNRSNQNCVDLHAPGRASDCPQRKHLCNNDLYRDVMSIQCRKTCELC